MKQLRENINVLKLNVSYILLV